MIRIGIICPSEIAIKRFLPSLVKLKEFKFIGVAIASLKEWEGSNKQIIMNEKKKAKNLIDNFGGELFESYSDLINSKKIDCVYIPLPPALHFKWAKLALLNRKHVMVEKPATSLYNNSQELINIANENGLALHENYMFTFHNQIKSIDEIIEKKQLGDIRLFRLSFGFPRRKSNDFRYNRDLGGGALLDCGGYTLKYASILLGKTTKINSSNLNYIKDFDVDISGSATLYNEEGKIAQIAFGMDNSYKCDLEIWGSNAYLSTGRIFTAPPNFEPKLFIQSSDKNNEIKLPSDDTFKKSILHFKSCIQNDKNRINNYNEILFQAKLVNEFSDNLIST